MKSAMLATAVALVGTVSLAHPDSAAAQLTSGGRTLAGGGGYKVDCTGAFGEDVVFSSAVALKEACVTVQADNNCSLIMRLKDSGGNVLSAANVHFNNTVARCAKGVASVTLERNSPGGIATVNWRVDDRNNK